ncbi:copper amine oxidase N-terminal domain-containing protein [Paenibacillus montanisoli]|uniref:Copper amine oxidase N-terminal domain-containing protein n=1 Tax=Paenibacillus montanisoli TaxID=2081970 RepID=A0A328U932_9BACL|nr:copper amine oxidase N-terminal domain-containing protein [Paenibacillus montanisoli]RAP76556.1 copper amine oxidase N-terminal domain-containing protein [Paenibacillus montanisoli]
MKKSFLGIFLAGFSLVLFSSPIYAAEIQINVDGSAIPSDMKPEIKNNRAMVPLRIISENLGANVEWANSVVTLTKGDMKLKLNVDSTTAIKNGKEISLKEKPYMKNNRIFVPLRFIAETFGSNVNYSKSSVTVDTEPLLIDDVQVKAVQQEYHMTMGGVVQQINGNAYNEAIYNTFLKNKGQKVKAPDSYSWWPDIDTPGHYYKNAQYDFLDDKANSLLRFDIYSLIYPDESSSGYPKVLMYDVTKDEWYMFNDNANQSINRFIGIALKNGFVKIISNTVV